MSIFKPNLILNKYSDLDILDFKNKGFKVLLLDVDNTITPYENKVPGKEAIEFVNKLKENGFEVIVVSNNTNARVSSTAKTINCEYCCWSMKPFTFKINSFVKKKGFDKSQIIMMGDQLITDILCANSLKVYSIYSKPLSDKDTFYAKISRFIERLIFKYILHEKV